jgi:hypothetical protein
VPVSREDEASRLNALQVAVDEAEARHGGLSAEAKAARLDLAEGHRVALRERGLPYTIPVDLGVNLPVYGGPVVFQTEGEAFLVTEANFHDKDRRLLVFRCQDSAGAFLGPPSEEGRNLLPIPRALVHEWVVTGGVAEFFNSPWSSWWLGAIYRPGTLRHFAMIFQDSVFHAFATSITVERLELTRTDLGPLLRDPGFLEQLTRFRNRPLPDWARKAPPQP